MLMTMNDDGTDDDEDNDNNDESPLLSSGGMVPSFQDDMLWLELLLSSS